MKDWDSTYYKEHSKVQESINLEILNALSFQGNERILDIGCGPGSLTEKIAQRVPDGEVIGIDISPNMIRQASRDYRQIPNLRFFKKSGDSFCFSGKFDLVLSFFALHWVKHHDKVLRCVQSSLKKQGRLIFLMVAEKNPLISEVLARQPWRTLLGKRETISHFNQVTYLALLKQFGFDQELLEVKPFTRRFAHIEDLSKHMMTWLPYATALPDDQCVQLAVEIAENLSQRQEAKTNIPLTTTMLLVKAQVNF